MNAKVIGQGVGYGLIAAAVYGLLLFWPAGTFDYWQAWVFLAVYGGLSIACCVYWGLTNPAVLQRRLRGGPKAEARLTQKLASTALITVFTAVFVVSALDHRFGWSAVPTAVSVLGEVVVVLGLGLGILAVVQNGYAAANITVEDEQPVISTGMYGLVRHPMYFSLLVTMVGLSLALGSYWGLTGALVSVPILVVRILDEEKLLTQELAGYPEYTQRVRYRLVPYLW
ncbi:methyltransferase family protein [[Mycobacterium] nativiensis]|uniref:Isoprenylcysteine carboxylmethyltransferase family protein n=1 Tax=[Mycobacterium] nativiensis TaxID=2855503 RepID=A0ABU5XTP6_9MYCO|nr:isoprenylcysteine carboxylmethyltransferase family protein [Mycolicibacter sp. MYC340]MEB3031352.1 isoprenylcysteine carboxylmethyltransferase family protein [Mycolicibacter sp. MYC340]